MSNIILVTGGARSGKSNFAESLCIKQNNRTAYMERINELEKNASEHPNIGIVTFDINFLKTTNDTLGHNMGDDLIKSAANIIKNTLYNTPLNASVFPSINGIKLHPNIIGGINT